MSLGSGHVWRTVLFSQMLGHTIDTDTLWEIVCVHCGARRGAQAGRVRRWLHQPKRGKLFEKTSFRFHHGRPLGTCSAGSHTAQRRDSGEAEIRATLERFE